MSTLRSCLIVAPVTLGLVSPAHAIDSTQTVQGLYQYCKSPEGSPLAALCLGYITGVGDSMQLLGFGVERAPATAAFAICDKPSYGAMVQAFTNWAEQNPRERETNRIVGVMTALRTNWPCKKAP
jgi:hypothetical protein